MTNPEAQPRQEKIPDSTVTEESDAAHSQHRDAEEDREVGKEKYLAERYASLPDNQKAEFHNAQLDAARVLNEHIQGQRDGGGLSPEESLVIEKLRAAYEEFKRVNPDKPFVFDFSKGIDRKVYNNLAQRLAFKVLEGRQNIGDQEEANIIRENLGIPSQEIKTEGLLLPEEGRKSEKTVTPDMYEQIANKIPINEKTPPKPEAILPILAGNMFGENDKQTLAGKIIGREIYDKLVQRLDHKQSLSAQEIIQLGKEDLEDFKNYISQLDEQSKNGGGKGYDFNVDRPAGATGFHLNGESGRVSRDHLFYFSKTTKEWKNPQEQQVRAYLTISPAETKNIQRHFVDLCAKLYEAGIDFTGKAASPNGLEKRTDNIVLYVAGSDQAKAGQMIKEFLQERKIGEGHVGAAIPSPDQEGLSWALEPTENDVKLWQNVSGSSERASYNAVVATKVAPAYLRRLAEAHLKLGNQNEANLFTAEADRVEGLIQQAEQKR